MGPTNGRSHASASRGCFGRKHSAMDLTVSRSSSYSSPTDRTDMDSSILHRQSRSLSRGFRRGQNKQTSSHQRKPAKQNTFNTFSIPGLPQTSSVYRTSPLDAAAACRAGQRRNSFRWGDMAKGLFPSNFRVTAGGEDGKAAANRPGVWQTLLSTMLKKKPKRSDTCGSHDSFCSPPNLAEPAALPGLLPASGSSSLNRLMSNASSGCYYYYYYNTTSTTSASADSPSNLSVAPFPPSPQPHGSGQSIAGFKLLLPIPIKRTICEGPRGPQLSQCEGLNPVSSHSGVVPLDQRPIKGGLRGELSEACDDVMTIWSDTSSCHFSDDSSHFTTGQSTAAVQPDPVPLATKSETSLLTTAHVDKRVGRRRR